MSASSYASHEGDSEAPLIHDSERPELEWQMMAANPWRYGFQGPAQRPFWIFDEIVFEGRGNGDTNMRRATMHKDTLFAIVDECVGRLRGSWFVVVDGSINGVHRAERTGVVEVEFQFRRSVRHMSPRAGWVHSAMTRRAIINRIHNDVSIFGYRTRFQKKEK